MTEKKKGTYIAVVGSGGREHAIIRKLLTSPTCDGVVCIGGNAGIEADVECVDLFANSDIVHYCKSKNVDLVVIGPEQPLVNGLADALRAEHIAVFGPSEAAAQLEASKDFTKKLCDEYNIPTAKYKTFASKPDAIAYVKKVGAPIVIKADGLAAGKGVTVAKTVKEALAALEECFDGAFGDAAED